jgi:hypothetical protein
MFVTFVRCQNDNQKLCHATLSPDPEKSCYESSLSCVDDVAHDLFNVTGSNFL